MGPMLRWFVFTIAFGLLPFGVAVLLQLLSGRAAMVPHSPALLFFAVMICAAQVGAIFSSFLDAQGSDKREILSPLFGVFLLGAVFSAAMYGVYMHHDLNDPGLQWNTSCSRPGVKVDGCSQWLMFRVNLFTLSVWVAAFAGVLGTWSEWTRSRG
jgi:hypothetical protein